MNLIGINEIILIMNAKKCEQYKRDCFYDEMSLNKYASEIIEPISNRHKIFAKWTQQIGICAECLKESESSNQ